MPNREQLERIERKLDALLAHNEIEVPVMTRERPYRVVDLQPADEATGESETEE